LSLESGNVDNRKLEYPPAGKTVLREIQPHTHKELNTHKEPINTSSLVSDGEVGIDLDDEVTKTEEVKVEVIERPSEPRPYDLTDLRSLAGSNGRDGRMATSRALSLINQMTDPSDEQKLAAFDEYAHTSARAKAKTA
jgi:hypothetical protein